VGGGRGERCEGVGGGQAVYVPVVILPVPALSQGLEPGAKEGAKGGCKRGCKGGC
jgi:hypothetical protein